MHLSNLFVSTAIAVNNETPKSSGVCGEIEMKLHYFPVDDIGLVMEPELPTKQLSVMEPAIVHHFVMDEMVCPNSEPLPQQAYIGSNSSNWMDHDITPLMDYMNIETSIFASPGKCF